MDRVSNILAFIGVASFGAVLGLSWSSGASNAIDERQATPPAHAATFGFCHTAGGTNCVVDGDTAWIGGVKVRIADIDAPETHEPRCPSEAALGRRATERLRELMNAGPFVVQPIARDEDKYGRKLRILVRDQQSLGHNLVKEGLARTYDGRRHPWC